MCKDITANETTTVLNQFERYVKEYKLEQIPRTRFAPPLYTPLPVESKHILDLPLFDERNRFFELQEKEVRLYKHEVNLPQSFGHMASGLIVSKGCLPAIGLPIKPGSWRPVPSTT